MTTISQHMSKWRTAVWISFGFARKGEAPKLGQLRRYPQMSSSCSNGLKSCRWTPAELIEHFVVGNGHACLVLNTKLCIPVHVVHALWANAQLRCMVDGGANRWRHFLDTHCQGLDMAPADFITGDFDSITKENSVYFEHPKTQRVHTPDQNATDFTKAVGVISPVLAEKQVHDIVVFHDTSGRFDQIMANINTLYKLQGHELNIFLLSGNAMTWLLRPGKHSITIPPELVKEQRWCALLPVGRPATCVTTSGLKWNLNKSHLEFGGLVSTSNTYSAEHVQITTNSCLIWSMGIFSME